MIDIRPDGILLQLQSKEACSFYISNLDGKPVVLERFDKLILWKPDAAVYLMTTPIREIGMAPPRSGYSVMFQLKRMDISFAANPREPVCPAELAKRDADKVAEKVDTSSQGWKADIANATVESLDDSHWKVSYMPIWSDGVPRLGGGFEIHVGKYNTEVSDPIWRQ